MNNINNSDDEDSNYKIVIVSRHINISMNPHY